MPPLHLDPVVQDELRALPPRHLKAAREILMDLAAALATEAEPYAEIPDAFRLSRDAVVVFYRQTHAGIDILRVRPNS